VADPEFSNGGGAEGVDTRSKRRRRRGEWGLGRGCRQCPPWIRHWV